MEAILFSLSRLSSSEETRAASFPRFGHSKARCGPLHRKQDNLGLEESALSSFFHLPLSLEAWPSLGDLSLSPPPLPPLLGFLPCPFCESFLLNSIKDSAAA